MNRGEAESIARQAGTLFATMSQSDHAAVADEILLLLYRLRDRCRIQNSTSVRFKGGSFAFLNDLLYELESRPDQTMRSAEWSALIETLMSDIATGRITLADR